MEGEFISARPQQGVYPPRLCFRIKLKNKNNWIYNIFAHEAELKLTNVHKVLATSIGFESFEIEPKSERVIEPIFELDYRKLDFIEENRSGDISFIINLNLIGIYRYKKDGYENILEAFQRGIQTFEVRVSSPEHHNEIVIAQSEWIKILEKLDYGKIKIIELSIPVISPSRLFNRAVKHFENAKRNFEEGKYPEVLTSCIHVIEELDKLINLNEKPKAKKHNLRQILGDEKAEAFKKIKNALVTPFLHFGEHRAREPPVLIDRRDAEFALHITLSLFNYFAKRTEEIHRKHR